MNGHPEASRYPLGRIQDETALVVDHLNQMQATQAVLLQMAVAGVLSKKGNEAFDREIRKLQGR